MSQPISACESCGAWARSPDRIAHHPDCGQSNAPAPSEPSADGLLPCPFCESEAEFTSRILSIEPRVRYGVGCTRCDCWCDFRAKSKQEAADSWNRRQPDPPHPHLMCYGS